MGLVQGCKQVVKHLALALATPAPACMESQNKKILHAFGIAIGASLFQNIGREGPDAVLVQPADHLVEESE